MSMIGPKDLKSLDDDGMSIDNASSQESISHEASSQSDTGNTGDGSSSQQTRTSDDLETIKDALTKRETKQVLRLRVCVVLLLVSVATLVSTTVYYVTKNAEKDEFEIQYDGVSERIIRAFQDIMVDISAVSALAVAATGEPMERGSEWPYVIVSNMQEKARNARNISGAIYVSLNPIVSQEQLPEWQAFVDSSASSWIPEGLDYQDKLGINEFVPSSSYNRSWLTDNVVDPLHTFDEEGYPVPTTLNGGPYLPRWETSPVLKTSMANENLFENHWVSSVAHRCIDTKSAVLSGFVTAPPGPTSHPDPLTDFFATLRSMWEGRQVEYLGDPMAHLTIPIFDSLENEDRRVVAVLKSTIHWRQHLRKLLPNTVKGIRVVLENDCDGAFTYEIHGDDAEVVGFGNQHDAFFDDYEVSGRFEAEKIEDGTFSGITLNQDVCPYRFYVYPTKTYYEGYVTKHPIGISGAIAAVFFFTISMFFVYDRLVERRQRIILAKAMQSTAIVSSLFPKQVRDRLLNDSLEKKKGDALIAPTHRLKTFLNGTTGGELDDQPIADFFPNCTVIFADIAGFTAWSSTREPTQVFALLQALYQAFDAIAKRRKVFKVETIGDSYVAVTGLPEAQPHHATIMAKFAWDCLLRVHEITKELEVSLGPDTAELSMRFGLHSGPVTAGVLKGDRARFQLFGDTVNTAARMEHTGIKGRIQVTEATANLLRESGKGLWLTARTEQVEAKGKGKLNTFWLALRDGTSPESATSSDLGVADTSTPKGRIHELSMKHNRLVGWMVDLLIEHIKPVVMVHQRCSGNSFQHEDLYFKAAEGTICLDEVKESIPMPKFDAKVMDAKLDSNLVEIPTDIVDSLREYVTLIAKSYKRNPFHNFEHACHVTMSVTKLLKRIVTPNLNAPEENGRLNMDRNQVAAEIHNFTHGIISDPLAAFALTFAALIHDVDHQGVSNAQLAKEEPAMGEYYRNRSVAEQNSLDVAWDLLMSENFVRLRKYVFGSRSELLRFRQLLVNSVLATDIFDKEIGEKRLARWKRAFNGADTESPTAVSDLRATIVMEHIIQASDVSHTMQHWHIYQKWNGKLFAELHKAWQQGKLATDPFKFWYQAELNFFDSYVIPLAQKLKECNVFGVSSDEYLGYAMRNRAEWCERGEDLVADMIRNRITE